MALSAWRQTFDRCRPANIQMEPTHQSSVAIMSPRWAAHLERWTDTRSQLCR